MDLEIPNKSLFKINEVCGLTEVKPYVLRFWEKEFEEIDPIFSSSGQKLYEHKDIEAIALIKKLLFEDKMSIEEAKKEMRILAPSLTSKEVSEMVQNIDEDESPEISEESLNQVKQGLRQLLGKLDSLRQRHNWN